MRPGGDAQTPTGARDEWLERLLAIAPPDEDAPAGPADWSALDPTDELPTDFRRLFDVYGATEVDARPLDGTSNRYATPRIPNPNIDVPTYGPGGYAWSGFEGPWRVVGVSRSSIGPWSTAPVPDVPFAGETWATYYAENERTGNNFVWAPAHDGIRVTVIVSFQRAAVWVLAMPPTEVVARHLVGLTGCPWLPGPEPGLADAGGSLVLRGQTIRPPAVEILEPGLLDGAPLPTPDPKRARADLDELRALVPPPAQPRPADWDAIAALLEGPIRDDIREVWDTYGAGQFTCDTSDDEGGDDEEAEWPPNAGLHWLPGKYVELVDDALETFDVSDLHGDRPIEELRAVAIGWLDGPEHDLWLYRCGDAHGLAYNDWECVTRLPGSAAGTLLDAIYGRGVLARLTRDTDYEHHPVTFLAG
jgi:hypothetical protein